MKESFLQYGWVRRDPRGTAVAVPWVNESEGDCAGAHPNLSFHRRKAGGEANLSKRAEQL